MTPAGRFSRILVQLESIETGVASEWELGSLLVEGELHRRDKS
jgi:hypothetical protein